MNKYIMTITWLLSLALIAGCGSSSSDDGGETTPSSTDTGSISLSKTSLSMAADAADNSEVIVTSNADWALSSDQTWCTPSPSSGHNGQTVLKVSTLSNKTGNERTANLTFTIKGAKKAA